MSHSKCMAISISVTILPQGEWWSARVWAWLWVFLVSGEEGIRLGSGRALRLVLAFELPKELEILWKAQRLS